jgi:uncharacterized repeat protein (TIGR01451 family)
MNRTAAVGLALLLLGRPALGVASEWAETTSLVPADRSPGNQFGAAVAVGKDILAVGAYLADAEGKKDSGKVYLYRKLNGVWSLSQQLPEKSAAGEWFGFDVAIDSEGKTLVVGAPSPGRGSGKAYVYDLIAGEAKNERFLAEGASGDEFGSSVAVDGNRIAVGARGANRRAGRVYVFTPGRDPQLLEARNPTAGRELGQSVALSGTVLVVGEPLPGEDGRSTGAAYVFDLDSTRRLDELPAPSGLAAKAAFGYSVAVKGRKILVGAPLADAEAGAVYRLDLDDKEKGWLPLTTKGGQFGVAVAMNGAAAVIGARKARSGAGVAYVYTWGAEGAVELEHTPKAGAELGFGTAINGDVLVVGAFQEGAAYVFERSTQTVTLSFAKVEPVETRSSKARQKSLVVEAPEGAAVPALVVLETSDGQPLRNPVTVTIDAVDGTARSESDYRSSAENTMTFAPGGPVEQQVPFSILPDCLDEDEETFTLSLSTDSGAKLEEPSKLEVRVEDAGLVDGIDVVPHPQGPLPLITSESGATATFGVKLTCKPTGKVVLAVASTNVSEGKVTSPHDRPKLVFTTDNWSTEQLVTVKGQDDGDCDGSEIYTIELTPASADPGYNTSKSVHFVNQKKDAPCPAATAEAEVCADGGTVRYTVKIKNTGAVELADLSGVELSDELPEELSVVTATADLGVATVDYVGNAVTWSGSIPVGSEATVEILATLEPDVSPGTLVANQIEYRYDADGDGNPSIYLHPSVTDTCPMP